MADKSTLFTALSGSAVMTKAEKLKLLQDLHKLLNEPTNTVVPRAYQEEGQQALAEFKSKPYPSVRLGVKEIASLLVPVLDAIKKLAVRDNDDTTTTKKRRRFSRGRWPCTTRHMPTRRLTPALAVARSVGFPWEWTRRRWCSG